MAAQVMRALRNSGRVSWRSMKRAMPQHVDLQRLLPLQRCVPDGTEPTARSCLSISTWQQGRCLGSVHRQPWRNMSPQDQRLVTLSIELCAVQTVHHAQALHDSIIMATLTVLQA